MVEEQRAPSGGLTAEHAALLARVSIFEQLDRVTLARLVSFTELRRFAPHATIWRQGDPPDGLYVVAAGSFDVLLEAEQQPSLLNSLTTGEAFGEMALLTGDPRSATVVAGPGGGAALRLDHERALEALRREPAALLAIAATLSRRLVQTNALAGEQGRTAAGHTLRALARLPEPVALAVLESALLPVLTAELAAVLWPECHRDVLDELTILCGPRLRPPDPLRRLLLDELLARSGSGGLDEQARTLASRLVSGGYVEDALALLNVHGNRDEELRLMSGYFQEQERLSRPVDAAAARWLRALTPQEETDNPPLARARRRQMLDRITPAGMDAVIRAAMTGEVSAEPIAPETTTARPPDDMGGPQAPWFTAARSTPAGGETQSAGWWSGRWQGTGRLVQPVVAVLAVTCLLAGIVAGRQLPKAGYVLLVTAAILFWTRQIVPDFVTGFALVAALVASGSATPAQAMAGFGSTDWIFVVATYGIAAAVARSGLLFRAGLLLVRRMPAGLLPQAMTLLATGVLLGPLLPTNMGRAALTGSFALAVADGRRLRPHDPAAATLGLAAWLGAGPLTFLFVNGAPFCLLAWGLLPPEVRQDATWLRWLAGALPLGIVAAGGGLWMMVRGLRPTAPAAAEGDRLAVQLTLLGRPRPAEYAMAAVLAITFAAWVVSPHLRLDLGTVAAFGLVGAALSGNFDRAALRDLDWNFLVFYGVALGLGRLVSPVGLSGNLAGGASQMLGHFTGHAVVFLAAAAVLSLVVRMVLPQAQAVLALCLLLLPAAPGVGVNPWTVAVTILAMTGHWLFPRATSAYMAAAAATEGRLYTHAQAARAARGYVLAMVAGLTVSLPYWWWLGLLG